MKKARILSLILASVMLLSLIPAIGVTVSADGATVTKPTTLPNPAYDNAGDATEGVYYHVTNGYLNADNTTNTSGGRLEPNDAVALPAETQGKTFTTTPVWSGSHEIVYNNPGETTLDTGVLISDDATGILLKVKVIGGSGDNAGLRFNPYFYTAADAATPTYKPNTNYTKVVYYFDDINGVWRASTPVQSHSFVLPNEFDGYVYMPFEAFSTGSALTSGMVRGMYIKSFASDYRWQATGMTLESVEIVNVSNKPTTLPDLAVENANDSTDGVYYHVTNGYLNADNTTNTKGGRLNAGDVLELPANTQGKTFTTTSVWSGSKSLGSNADLITLESGVAVSNDATGILVRVQVIGGSGDNAGFRFRPHFYSDANATSATYTVNQNYVKTVYYFDDINGVWRATLGGTALSHSFCLPNDFDGYIYMPFEAFSTGTALNSSMVRGMYLKSFDADYRWQATGMTLKSVEIVNVSDDLPTRLPDPSYTAGTTNNKEGVWKTYYGVHNNADGSIATGKGRLEADDAGALPAATQGQAFKTTPVWNGSFAATDKDNPGEAQATLDTAVAVPAGAVGMLIKVDVSGTSGNSGIRFNPDFYSSAEDTTADFQCVTDNTVQTSYVYYYDTVNSVWRASGAEHSYRVPDEFNGYVYIPFETYLTHAKNNAASLPMDSTFVKDMYIKGFRVAYGWGAASFTIQNISFVSIAGLSHASITLDSNLNLNVYATVMDASSVATMTITPENTDLEAKIDMEGVYVADLDAYRFTYEDILPQYMTENFTFELTVDGAVVATKNSYSIRTYCENMLAKIGDTDPELKTLLIDILNYGAAAQTKAGHKTDDLANKNIDSTAGTDVTSKNPTAPTGAASSDVNNAMTSASLRLENAIVFRLNLKATDISNVNVSVSGLGTLRNYNGDAIKPGATAGTYYIMIDNIYATQFDNQITVTMSVNGIPVQTLTFSVNAYLAAMTDAAWVDVVDSVYAYGQSASAYVTAKKNS